MRILFMADVEKDPHAGAAGTEIRTIDHLRRLGHEVTEIWANDLGRRIGHGNLHYLLELPFAYRRALRRAWSRGPYDVVHVNQPHGWRAAKWLRGRAPFVHRSHGFEPYAEEVLARWRASDERSMPRRTFSAAIARLLARHGRLIAKYADGHIVSSSLDANVLIERFHVPPERVAVIPQAAPDAFLETPAPPMTSERLRRVLYVGQFAFFKAPTIVAEAMRKLAGESELTWVCAPQHHEQVRALVPSVRVQSWMPEDALRQVYDTHGIFLFPSYYEGFGKVFLEAMSRGMCVVASDVGGAHDVIAHGRDGMLVPPGDSDAIASAVRSLDLERASAMSDAAAQTARAYSWARVANETAAFYERLR
jgi:glycosyltransferase involved in cell wall biosynthesis